MESALSRQGSRLQQRSAQFLVHGAGAWLFESISSRRYTDAAHCAQADRFAPQSAHLLQSSRGSDLVLYPAQGRLDVRKLRHAAGRVVAAGRRGRRLCDSRRRGARLARLLVDDERRGRSSACAGMDQLHARTGCQPAADAAPGSCQHVDGFESSDKTHIIWIEPVEDIQQREALWSRIVSGDRPERF